MRKIAILMTCYNRVETTLACLRRLYQCVVPCEHYAFDVWLVDDASPDGTGGRVKATFPEINVVTGTGKLFWCGGMRTAWTAAANSGNAYDGYLWLNDDAMLFDDALQVLLEDAENMEWKCVVGGAFRDPESGELFYSATDIKALNGTSPIESHGFLNGNLVLIPDCVYRKIGGLSPSFTHQYGDYEYTHRAQVRGVKTYLARKVVGECKKNLGFDRKKFCTLGFWERLRRINDPKWYGLMEFYHYKKSVYGLLPALLSFFKGCVAVVCPRIIV